MLVDYCDDDWDLFPLLDPMETLALRAVTDRLFVFITNQSIKRPQETTFSLNNEGEKQATYALPFFKNGDQLIFPELTIVQERSLGSGNSILRSSVEIKVMSADDYETGSLTYTPNLRSLPLSTYWIEDSESFHPFSMSSQFAFECNHYQFFFNNHGDLIEIQANDLASIGNPTFAHTSRTRIERYTNKIDMQIFMEDLHYRVNSQGGYSNLASTVNQRVDIPMTNFFAMMDLGYRVTPDFEIIPLLIYR
jgi:hypothetical protein